MSDLTKLDNRPERFRESEEITQGTWVWVACRNDDDKPDRWFGCVTNVGSNYIEVTEPHSERQSWHNQRIHVDRIKDEVTIEHDPESVIRDRADKARNKVRALMDKARKLLQDLGLRSGSLPQPDAGETTALAVASRMPDVARHKKALVKAKDKDLPDIFKAIEAANQDLVRWMSAQALPMHAMAESVREVVGDIEDRIFTVELYAGLLEKVVQVRDGEPAGMDDRLRVMQRRLYMDEECLLSYEAGGIDIHDIKQFDRWISSRKNFERVLPFPRCMVAFRVRRHVKHRTWDGTFAGAFVQVRLEQSDKLTFMYIRNGDKLYRMNTEIEFGSTLFPDRDEYVLHDQMWAAMYGSKVDHLVTDGQYQEMLAKAEKKRKEDNKLRRKGRVWAKAHPKASWISNPYWHNFGDYDEDDDPVKKLEDYEPFDSSSVYFDDIGKKIEKQIQAYNRIAYVVQGLFDRPEMLHPHPPAKLWTREGFDAAVELVFDSDRALYPSAEPPDFEAYRAACNASLGAGSVTVGQEDYWEKIEAKRYNERENRNNWRRKHAHVDVEKYRPHNNPGPGRLARVVAWAPRSKKATYEWQRERAYSWSNYWERREKPYILTRLKVPASQLLCVNGYKPGDFRQFFEDPRTRAGYPKWAEVLLTAEEYHAGNIEVGGEWKKGKD